MNGKPTEITYDEAVAEAAEALYAGDYQKSMAWSALAQALASRGPRARRLVGRGARGPFRPEIAVDEIVTVSEFDPETPVISVVPSNPPTEAPIRVGDAFVAPRGRPDRAHKSEMREQSGR